MIRFLLQNFTLTLLVFGLIASAISLLRRPRPWTACIVVEALFSYFILFSIAPGNAGVIFYTDILLPVIGFALLWLEYRCSRDTISGKMTSCETSSIT